MKVLVLGNDGRTHALAWRLFNSKQTSNIVCSPGNGGTGQLIPQENIPMMNISEVAQWAFTQDVDFIIPAASEPLQAGLFDEAHSFHIRVCGPPQQISLLIASRCASKEFLLRHQLPTALGRSFYSLETAERYLAAQPLPVVIKADHCEIASRIYEERYLALQGLRELFKEGPLEKPCKGVVIEPFLPGPMVSLSALTDGETILPFLPTHIYRYLYEDDKGPLTKGIGANTGVSNYAQKLRQYMYQQLLKPLVAALAHDDMAYQGIIGIDCIITPRGPRIVGLRCSLRDQEAQVVLPRLEDDFLPLLYAAITRNLNQFSSLRWKEVASVGITLFIEGYPYHFPTGSPIEGLTKMDEGILIFHNETFNPYPIRYDGSLTGGPNPFAKLIMGIGGEQKNTITTTGGHVLTIVALAGTLNGARGKAIVNAERIHFPGRSYRGDIGQKEFG